MMLDDVCGLIEEWGAEKGLHKDAGAQIEKFFEETGELARAHGEVRYATPDVTVSDEIEKLADAIGDCAVVLIQIAAAHGLTFEDCVRHAWGEIKERQGEVRDGIFVKETDL